MAKSVATITKAMLTKIAQTEPPNIEPNAYTTIPTKYEAVSQNKSVHLNLPFTTSPFAVATEAKQGTVVILNAIKEMSPGMVTPVATIMRATSKIPSSEDSKPMLPGKHAASAAKVATTFSFAIKPVTAATTNTQPHSPS